MISGPEVLKEFRALPAEERRRVAEVILTDDNSWIPESFRQGMEDIAAGRVMDMGNSHASYDKDFRQEAVNLRLSSGRPLKRVAAELGVSANSLRTWRDGALGTGGEKFL